MGLLSKASFLDISEKLAFSDFVKSNNIKTCAILESFNNFFFIKNSIGFDSVSILSSYSTYDFWNGVCSDTNKIYSYSKDDNSINPLLQLFSFTMKDLINNISIYKTINDKILLLVNQNITQKIISNFEKVDNNYYPNYKFSNILLNNEETFYEYEISLEFLNVSYKTNEIISIINELINRFLCFYSDSKHCRRTSQNKIRLFFIENNNFSIKAFESHIKLNLLHFIENNNLSVTVNLYGKTTNINDVISFMTIDA